MTPPPGTGGQRRAVLVTGASRGIGAHIAERLVAAGWDASLSARTSTTLADAHRRGIGRRRQRHRSVPGLCRHRHDGRLAWPGGRGGHDSRHRRGGDSHGAYAPEQEGSHSCRADRATGRAHLASLTVAERDISKQVCFIKFGTGTRTRTSRHMDDHEVIGEQRSNRRRHPHRIGEG